MDLLATGLRDLGTGDATGQLCENTQSEQEHPNMTFLYLFMTWSYVYVQPHLNTQAVSYLQVLGLGLTAQGSQQRLAVGAGENPPLCLQPSPVTSFSSAWSFSCHLEGHGSLSSLHRGVFIPRGTGHSKSPWE